MARRIAFTGVVALAMGLSGLFLSARGAVGASGTWGTVGGLADARSGATATLLDDGRVLIVGGETASGVSATVEVVGGPAAPNLFEARTSHTATKLPDGRVLVAGGRSAVGVTLATAEIFDPWAGSWSSLPLQEPRADHTATLVGGRVILIGGTASGGALASIEVFDPHTGTFAPLGHLGTARLRHAVAVLEDDRLFVTGGSDGGAVLASTEFVDAGSGGVGGGPSMSVPRAGHTATDLLGGDALIVGGFDGSSELASVERFDDATGAFVAAGGLSGPRQGHVAIRLEEHNGVLVAGGSAFGVDLTSAEIFKPSSGFFVLTGSAGAGHRSAAVFSEGAGSVLVAAGNGSGAIERYHHATIATDKDDYAPGEIVTITGTGWMPGETVTLRLQEVGGPHPDRLLAAVADGSGNILNTDFVPEEHHLGVRFYLTATDSRSEAFTTFTDSRTITGATLDGGSTVTVAPGASIDATVFVTTATGGGTANWRGTQWRIATTPPGTLTCVNTPDHDGAGSYTETFNVQAPGASGTYNAYFIAYQNDGCTQQASNTFVLANAVIVDAAPPSVVSIARLSGSPTNAALLAWTVTFSETVSGVDPTDFALAQGGNLFGAYIDSVAPAGPASSYTVTAFSGSLTGTLGLNLVDDDSIVDAAGNKLNGAASGSFTGEVYAVDRTLIPAITADDKTYDGTTTATLASCTFSSALTVGEDVGVLCTGPAFADANAGVGKAVTATVDLTGDDESRYELSSVTAAATATIAPATLAVTPDPQTIVYGQPAPTFTFTYSGFVSTDDATDLTQQAVCGVSGPGPYAVGQHPISCTAGTATNYVFDVTATAMLTVTPATLAVVPDPQSVVYGQSDPAFTFSYAGFVLGENAGVLTAPASCSVPGSGPHPVGDYAIACVAGSALNYVFDVTATAMFSVTPATLTVTPDPQAVVYGSADPPFTFSYAGFVLGEGAGALTAPATCGVPGTSPHPVGDYLISCAAGAAANYVFDVTATATFSVTAASLAVIPDPQTVGYGGHDPPFTFSYGGFVLGDDEADLLTQATCGVTGSSPHPVGDYLITCTAGTAANYVFDVTATATFSVTAATLAVIPDPQTVVYGADDPAFTFSYGGFVLGDDATALTTPATCDVPGSSPHAVGDYLISCTAGAAANYVFDVTATATFAVTPATLVVTPDPLTVVYGESDPAFTFSYGGFVLGDDATALTAPATCGVSGASPHPVGDYLISCAAGTAANYVFDVTVTATFAVTPATLVVTPDPQTVIYGQSDPAFTFNYGGFVLGDDATALTAPATCAVPGSSPHPVGDYLISCTAGAAANYVFDVTATATFAVTPATLVVTPDPQTVVYGQSDPAFTFSYGGFVLNDDATALAAPAMCGVPGSSPHAVGDYLISCAAGAAGNYVFDVTATATFAVTPATLVVTPDPQTVVYGADDPLFTFNYGGFVLHDDATALTAPATCGVPGSSPHAVGDYLISCTAGAAANYVFDVTATATFAVTPATLVVTPDPQTVVYGENDPAFTFSYGGFVLNDDATALTAPATCAVPGSSPHPVGDYLITCTAGEAANYVFDVTATATFAVTPATLVVTPDPQTVVYGESDPAFTFSYGGFVLGDDATALTAPATCGVPGSSPHPVGDYLITCTAGAAANYVFDVTATATFSVTPATLTVKADDQAKIYDGLPFTGFTVSYTGFVLSDGATDLGGVLAFTGSAIGATDANTYVITPGGVTSPNYQIVFADGTLTIDPRPTTASVVAHDKTYDGTADAAIETCSVDAAVAGDDVTCAAGAAAFDDKHVGVGRTVIATGIVLSGAAAPNYALTTTTATTTADVIARLLTVTATGIDKVYDATTVAAVALADDRLSGDDLTVAAAAATFDSRHVGTNKPVSVTGLTISGGLDQLNYALASTEATTAADVTVRTLTLTAVTNTKTYDGDTSAGAVPTVSGLQTGDAVTGLAEVYDTPDAGVGKTMSVSAYLVNDGNGGANYVVVTVSDPTGVILRAPQAITIIAPASPASAVFGTTVVASATGGASGSPVTFSPAPGSGCTNVGETFTITSGVTPCTIQYDQAGTSNYLPAPQVTRVVNPIGYAFAGFTSPISMSTPTANVWNTVNAGQAVPAKWRLTLNGQAVSNLASFAGLYQQTVPCGSSSWDVEDPVLESAPGSSGLQYHGDGNFQFNWKTPKDYMNSCRVMFVRFNDGSMSAVALFKFKK